MQLLPKEELYAPPLNIRVMDKRSFGRCPLVGTHVVKCMRSFIVEPKPSQSHKLAVAVAHKVATPTPSIYEGEVTVVVEDVKEALDVSYFPSLSFLIILTSLFLFLLLLLLYLSIPLSLLLDTVFIWLNCFVLLCLLLPPSSSSSSSLLLLLLLPPPPPPLPPLQSDPDSQKKVEFDWWSKYYYSIDDPRRTQQEYIDEGYDKMKVKARTNTHKQH